MKIERELFCTTTSSTTFTQCASIRWNNTK